MNEIARPSKERLVELVEDHARAWRDAEASHCSPLFDPGKHHKFQEAEEASKALLEEIDRQLQALREISMARVDWGLLCECNCNACRMLDKAIRERVGS